MPNKKDNIISRAFEFRAVSPDPKADGETDFKGETSVFSTEERVSFLNAYADYASKWFGDFNLDSLAVNPNDAKTRLSKIKTQPLPGIRCDIHLIDGWKQVGIPVDSDRKSRSLPKIHDTKIKDGALHIPKGKTEILDLNQSAGWRYELFWRVKLKTRGTKAEWFFGPDGKSSYSYVLADTDRCHEFRLQADLVFKKAYLSMDGCRIADFAIEHPAEKSFPFTVISTGDVILENILFIDYKPKDDKRVPYVPVVIADDTFKAEPDIIGWNGTEYDDSEWTDAELPCAHGGFREAGEDLCLRRQFNLDQVGRAWLEVETLDPSGEIYLNGKLVANIANRRPVFLDVTSFLKTGSNLLAFKVNYNRVCNPSPHAPADQAIGWFAGRTTLHVLSYKIGIRELLVNTESLDCNNSACQVHKIKIDNASEKPFKGLIEIAYCPWFPEEGEIIVSKRFPVSVPGNLTHEEILRIDLPNIIPWSPESPVLYSVHARLSDEKGKLLDDMVVTTGIRTVAQREGLFLLNGRPAMLNGAQTMGLRPFPYNDWAAKYSRCASALTLMTELLMIKNMGGNLLRVHVHAAKDTADGINDPRIAEMADQLGIMLMWGSPSWLREGDERNIDTDSIGFYIRQVYNHPSIVIWELSNHPNRFKEEQSPERTHEFVRRTVNAVLPVDTSRLISPTTFWQHTHYGNDLGTIDRNGKPVTPVPEYTHPLVTRGTQDAPTGYGKEWDQIRKWPEGLSADCLKNRIRAWFNFEHEESAAQPNWNLSEGWPWHRLRSYEIEYEAGSIGRILDFGEWRASQAWQAFSAYESMRKQKWHGVSGFSWCTIEGGANSGTYEKPLLDPFGHAKLAWHIQKMLFQPVLAGSDNTDTVYGPNDKINPCVFNLGPARNVELTVTVKSPDGKIVDERIFTGLKLKEGRSLLKLSPFRPKLLDSGFCVVEYAVKSIGK